MVVQESWAGRESGFFWTDYKRTKARRIISHPTLFMEKHRIKNLWVRKVLSHFIQASSWVEILLQIFWNSIIWALLGLSKWDLGAHKLISQPNLLLAVCRCFKGLSHSEWKLMWLLLGAPEEKAIFTVLESRLYIIHYMQSSFHPYTLTWFLITSLSCPNIKLNNHTYISVLKFTVLTCLLIFSHKHCIC